MEVVFLRALTSGPWARIDVYNERGDLKIGERVPVRAMESGTWNIDNRPVNVLPGLVVGFNYGQDAMWFLEQGRAEWITVEPGMCFAFENQADADFFVRLKLAQRISQAEAQARWQAEAAAAGWTGGDDDQGDGSDDNQGNDDDGQTEDGKQGHDGGSGNKSRANKGRASASGKKQPKEKVRA